MNPQLEELKAAVEAEDTVIQSAVTAFAGLADLITAAAGDKAATLALAEDVKARTAELAAAIPAGTQPAPAS